MSEKDELALEFPVATNLSRIAGWGCLLCLGLAFTPITVFAVRPVERLLAGAFAIILIAVSSRMLWPIFSLTGIRLDGANLLVLRKRADALSFSLPADVKEVSRFGANARNEMVVVLGISGITFRLVTSQYCDAERLRRLLAEQLKLNQGTK